MNVVQAEFFTVISYYFIDVTFLLIQEKMNTPLWALLSHRPCPAPAVPRRTQPHPQGIYPAPSHSQRQWEPALLASLAAMIQLYDCVSFLSTCLTFIPKLVSDLDPAA